MSKPKIKIVNKNKEGVTLGSPQSGGIEMKMTWASFEAKFDMVKGEKYYCTLKEDAEKEFLLQKDKEAFFKKHMLMVMSVMKAEVEGLYASSIKDFYGLSVVCDDYRDEFGEVSIADFITDLKWFIAYIRALPELMLEAGKV